MTRPGARGTLFTVSVGPGDPELLTVKAARILGSVPHYAFFAKRGRPGHAATVAARWLRADAEALRFDYPMTTERPPEHPDYRAAIEAFYEHAAGVLARRLDAGGDVALLCEGDAFFFGSAMYVFDHLAGRYRHEVIPGVTGMSGGWARALLPMTHGDDVLSVLPGTLDAAALTARLAATDAVVVMKVGSHLPKIRAAIADAGRLAEAVYVERATMDGERIVRLAELSPGEAPAPYFSLILLPGRKRVR
jgi:precorrin-2/cobalt-factor-2 C20-methyltransferase